MEKNLDTVLWVPFQLPGISLNWVGSPFEALRRERELKAFHESKADVKGHAHFGVGRVPLIFIELGLASQIGLKNQNSMNLLPAC
ncbi:hypothetical protein CRG98_049899 [Punica granatum]|nr:hypothetical protein CRG98_049899 [Punica granatum]